ncbi:site-specific integrase [Pseudovibrio sp. POLY-S9]|uniref:tyrosine-type recombinase/integrase n=1 Tax=Pseudovibrio sp. POLY-S9 TaxID=1576596 RepID=UPI00070B6D19|nr:site-specific integrase [Pseudovibrio sp. POLY-S9]
MPKREYKLVMYRGKWCVYFQGGGKSRRISTGTPDRNIAEGVAPQIVKSLESKSVKTVADIWEACVKDKEEQGQVIAKNMPFHWKALEGSFGEKLPASITPQDCRKYCADRSNQGKKPATYITELKHLRLSLNWGVKHGLIPAAPFIEVPPEPTPKDRYLTKEEFNLLFEAAQAHHIKVAMALMIATAGRIEAILELTWDRVDFERSKIRLQDPFTSRRQKGRAIVPMNNSLRAILQTAYDNRTCRYVVEWAGEPVKSVRKGFHNAADKAGLKDVTPHVLRHTAAVWMAEAGIAMEEIAQYLGHSSPKTTRDVYAKYSPEYLATAADALTFGQIK